MTRRRERRLSRRWSRRGDTGNAAVEVAVLIPGLLLMIGLLVVGGRVWFARTTVNEAAQTSARAASLARSASEAAVVGREAGQQSLATAGLRCASSSVSVNTSGFAVAVGTPATVTSSVRCRVTFSDVAIPGLPGGRDLAGHGTAALDTYRTR